MSELPVSVSADGLESWNDAVRRAEHGEVVAVIAHGKHVADVVPSGELDRLRETIEILSDPDAYEASFTGGTPTDRTDNAIPTARSNGVRDPRTSARRRAGRSSSGRSAARWAV